MPPVRLAGRTFLHVLRDGPPDADVTVVFCHGYALDHRCWHPLASMLPAAVERPVQVVRYDHRGHGRSSRATERTATVQQLGDDLAKVIADVARGSVVLVGHSMGGMCLLALAERHPELLLGRAGEVPRVAGLVLLSTGAGELAAEVRAATGLAVEASTGLSAVINRLMVDLEKVLGPKLFDVVTDRAHRAMTTAMRWSLFGDDPREEDVLLTLRMVRDHWPRAMAMFRPGLDAYVREAALRVPPGTPVVGLAGERDRLVPPERVRALLQPADGGTTIVLPGAGHMLPLEAAALVLPRVVALVHEVQRRLGDQARQPGD
ncbi:MAG: alpha/beta fold hydrolase [Thermocrispum sp.]